MPALPPRLEPTLASFGFGAFVLLVPVAAQDDCDGPSSNRVLDKLVSYHCTGSADAFTSSPDGLVLFFGEGGLLGVIDDTTNEAKWHASDLKLTPIGNPSLANGTGGPGLIPMALALDPAATYPYDRSEPSTSPNDLIYIAGGRMGLWVADADQYSSHSNLRVARIDDAPVLDASQQTSRRWCCDVDFVTLGGTTYLLSLCSSKDDTKVRVFKLTDARQVINAHLSDETGHELQPWKNIPIGRNPAVPSYHPSTEPSRSFGYSMTVDVINVNTAYVYVAMGEHGLARLHLTTSNLSSSMTWPVAGYTQWGPVFGDDTDYADSNSLYDNIHYYGFETLSQNCEERGVDRPYFVDVAVQNDGPSAHFLYAAVDHLGWLQINVATPSAWASNTAIQHHEGIPSTTDVPGGCTGDDIISLVTETQGEDTVYLKLYPHRLSVVHKDGNALLVVLCAQVPLVQNPLFRNEGQVYTYDVRYINGLGEVGTTGPSQYTLIYDLANLGGSENHILAEPSGGDNLYVFPTQSAPSDQLDFFVGIHNVQTVFADEDLNPDLDMSGMENATSRYTVDYEAGTVLSVFSRSREDRPGRMTHVVGHFHDKPELLVLGLSDCCIDGDGVTAACSDHFDHYYNPPSGQSDDPNGTFGMFFDPDSQWPYSDSSVCAGDGAYVFGGTSAVWRMSQYCFGVNFCDFGTALNPTEIDAWKMTATRDRLLHLGGGYLQGGLNLQYDQENDQGWEMVFATRWISEGGLIVARRDTLVTHANDPQTGDEFEMGPNGANAETSILTTHPEYANVPHSTAGDHFLTPQKSGIVGSCSTWGPELFKLPGSISATEPDTWVMAVPCGSVYFPASVDQRYSDEWNPDAAYLAKHGKHMIRFWNIQDPDSLRENQPHHNPFAQILGPNGYANSSAGMCKTVEHDGRVLMFVADHGGRVFVYDVTYYLYADPIDTVPLAVWEAPDSVTDDQKTNIRSIAVDHAMWTSGSQSYDEIYVYASVWRYGIQVLRFCWGTASPGDEELQPIELIQTPGHTNFVHLRETEEGKSLIMADGPGLRVYTYNF